MVIVRPVRPNDLPALMDLVGSTGIGLTTLPNDLALMQARIAASLATFAGTAARADEQWVFVMEAITPPARPAQGTRLIGICAIAGAVGLREPWYSYRVGNVVHASRELGIFTQTPTLFLSNDLTGASELCSLFLHPDFRVGRNGALLSKSRLIFMAQFRQRFAKNVIAEMRGVSDESGRSPFWESLGRHFFSMDFAEADRLTGAGKKSFVAELMPKHPLYSSFLTAEAQAVIGQTHPLTTPARRLLEQEGFRYAGHVDIFDAGPALEANLEDIDAVKRSIVVKVVALSELESVAPDVVGTVDQPLMLVGRTDLENFAVGLARIVFQAGGITIDAASADALGIQVGASVRVVALRPADRH